MVSTPISPIRVYADTSVYGGVFDEEFAEHSQQFFDEVRDGRFRLVTSPSVMLELQGAPLQVRTFFQTIASDAETVVPDQATDHLQSKFLDSAIVGPKSSEDARHVALAIVNACSVLVSWNFKHIVHRVKALSFNAVSALHGYPPIDIRSPREVIHYAD